MRFNSLPLQRDGDIAIMDFLLPHMETELCMEDNSMDLASKHRSESVLFWVTDRQMDVDVTTNLRQTCFI
jgi:hypothetical protein